MPKLSEADLSLCDDILWHKGPKSNGASSCLNLYGTNSETKMEVPADFGSTLWTSFAHDPIELVNIDGFCLLCGDE